MNAPQPPREQEGVSAAVAAVNNNTVAGHQTNQQQQQQQDPGLRLRRTELERALLIKQAVERDERIRHQTITDFDYVQWSLTTVEDPIEVVVEKVYRMQCFRDEYNIQDTLQECADIWCQLAINLMPGCHIAFDYVASDGCFVAVMDLSKYNPTMIRTERDYKIFFAAQYYLWEGASQNFQTIRKGLTCMSECLNCGFSISDVLSTLGQRVLNRSLDEFFLNYPKNDNEYYFVNSPMAVLCLYGIMKPMLSPKQQRAFKLGCTVPSLEGRSLTAFYHVPSATAATARVLKCVCNAWDQRYKNRNRFSFADSEKYLMD